MRRKIAALVLFCVFATAFPAPAAQQPLYPAAQITFEGSLVGIGATFSWGRGWLTFQGKSYPIKVEGLGIVGVGLSQVRARGQVYNLKKPRDITGTYMEAGAGIALVGGVKGFLAKNERGIVIDLVAEQKGVSFNLGGGTFTITMTMP